MNQMLREQASKTFSSFRIPRYHEIPDMGLYLEQTVKYTAEYLQPLGDMALTPSMISNYVKKGLIPSPVRKQYGREQIAYLFFIAIAKNVLSLDALAKSIRIQQKTYDLEVAYDCFCRLFEEFLRFAFELDDTLEFTGEDSSDEKRLLYTCVVAAVEKIYVEYCLAAAQV